MASAIIRGLLEKQHYLPAEIACTAGKQKSGPNLAAETGIQFYPDISAAAQQADVIVIACKPQQIGQMDPSVLEASKGSLVLSVLAGTTLSRLSQLFPQARNIVRTMPNTPGQIGAGITAYAPFHQLSESDQANVSQILSSLGKFHRVEESDLDAVTAISGSGPAYVFEFCAALREAAINNGLEADLAHDLAIETLLGASQLMRQSDQSPEALRDAVTSPNGTTAAALNVFAKNDLRHLVNEAVQAAIARSIELGQG